MATPTATRYKPQLPCPVCETGTKGCSVTIDGLQSCRGIPADTTLWDRVSGMDNAGFSHWRPAKASNNGYHAKSSSNGNGHHKATATTPAIDWPARAGGYADKLTPELANELARSLRLPVESLAAIPLLGWDETEEVWTLPESDGAGQIIGIVRRYRDGRKKAYPESRRGLTLPVGWVQADGPIHIVEGPSDVLALTLCGLTAIGRPSNTGGAEMLATLLRGTTRPIYVWGERDAKPDGKWPGKEGVDAIAPKLAAALQRQVMTCYPQPGSKDARQWVCEQIEGAGDTLDLKAIGREIAEYVAGSAETVKPPTSSSSMPSDDPFDKGISLKQLLEADLPPPRFDYVDLLPEGLVILAGRPKQGKSWLAMSLGISLADGASWLGTNPTITRPVLHLALEDTRRRYRDRAKKIIAATGGNATDTLDVRTEWPRANSGGLTRLGEWLSDHPGALVIIDTLAKFRDPPKGRGSSYDEDYAAISALKSLADQYGACILIISHTRKGAADDPFDEISGTLGICGAADAMMVLDRVRGSESAALYCTGRDLPEATLTLKWDSAQCLWTMENRQDGTVRAEKEAKPDKIAECAKWAREFIGKFSWPDNEVEAAAEGKGFNSWTYRQAKGFLRKENPALQSKPSGQGKEWWCWFGQKGTRMPDRPPPNLSQNLSQFDAAFSVSGPESTPQD